MEWPRPNEKLIKSDVDWQNNACVDCTTPIYAPKFKAAADRLVHDAMLGKATIDEMVIPIMYLYRHYLELSLKQIIELGRELSGGRRKGPSNLDKSHNLKFLWQQALNVMVSHYGAAVPPETQNVTTCLEDMDAYDPNSFSFRYPRDWSGRPYLTGVLHINIRNLFETMNRLASFLDCIAIDLGQRCEQ